MQICVQIKTRNCGFRMIVVPTLPARSIAPHYFRFRPTCISARTLICGKSVDFRYRDLNADWDIRGARFDIVWLTAKMSWGVVGRKTWIKIPPTVMRGRAIKSDDYNRGSNECLLVRDRKRQGHHSNDFQISAVWQDYRALNICRTPTERVTFPYLLRPLNLVHGSGSISESLDRIRFQVSLRPPYLPNFPRKSYLSHWMTSHVKLRPA